MPERTIRSWLQQTREELAEELPDLRRTHLLLAIDSLRQLLATTWELLTAECDAELDARTAAARFTPTERLGLRPRRTNAPRYLALAFALQKELTHLLSLDIPIADTENTTPSQEQTEIPAETAIPLAHSQAAADHAAPESFTDRDAARTHIAAETATSLPPVAIPPQRQPAQADQRPETAGRRVVPPSRSEAGFVAAGHPGAVSTISRPRLIRPSPTLAKRLAPARASAADRAFLADLNRLAATATRSIST